MRNKDAVLTRDFLLASVWGDDYVGDARHRRCPHPLAAAEDRSRPLRPAPNHHGAGRGLPLRRITWKPGIIIVLAGAVVGLGCRSGSVSGGAGWARPMRCNTTSSSPKRTYANSTANGGNWSASVRQPTILIMILDDDLMVTYASPGCRDLLRGEGVGQSLMRFTRAVELEELARQGLETPVGEVQEGGFRRDNRSFDLRCVRFEGGVVLASQRDHRTHSSQPRPAGPGQQPLPRTAHAADIPALAGRDPLRSSRKGPRGGAPI